jgi:hypothetical protein
MPSDYFASDKLHVVIAWLAGTPALLAIVGVIIDVFKKQEDSPWFFTAWVGLCFLLFSPLRYMLFLLVAAASYPFQSWSAFVSSWLLAVLVPIPFMILLMVGVVGPYVLVLRVATMPRWGAWLRLLTGATLAPIAAFVGAACFGLLLPFAAIVTHWLHAEDVIRATNGPAYYAFSWFGSSRLIVQYPTYADRTPGKARDLMRCHVAALYLSAEEHARFVKLAYPTLYDEILRRADVK